MQMISTHEYSILSSAYLLKGFTVFFFNDLFFITVSKYLNLVGLFAGVV